MPPKKAAAAAAASVPLGETDANRVVGHNKAAEPAEKPASKSRKRKSDAAADGGDDDAAAAPAPKKQATKKKAAEKKNDPLPDLSGIELHGDDDMNVPVFDTCDTVRTKIRAILKKEGVTKAAFLRAIVKAAYRAGSDHKIAPNLLTNFMNKKGPVAGNTSTVFYAAYVFFEKLRVRDRKPKGKKREEMEDEWPTGFETKELLGGPILVHASEKAYINQYGKTHVY
ncbi:calcineurin is a calcium-dependent [Colletotrichum orchidophilum]|uniref:Calcineurin is a calcium-dependent n=1 Tax=Colletotrichum orchidophilum TaxID=1209926 RepID=A0A1G4B954_9PEZI|nr:calcineurin is a calcium-dependent [Colletotrichum orchidophilum]OHE97866.1 calcineurin is a calcium-dependent [Colletotrichum orchidophilum]